MKSKIRTQGSIGRVASPKTAAIAVGGAHVHAARCPYPGRPADPGWKLQPRLQIRPRSIRKPRSEKQPRSKIRPR